MSAVFWGFVVLSFAIVHAVGDIGPAIKALTKELRRQSDGDDSQ